MIQIKREDLRELMQLINDAIIDVDDNGSCACKCKADDNIRAIYDHVKRVCPMTWRHKGCGGEIVYKNQWRIEKDGLNLGELPPVDGDICCDKCRIVWNWAWVDVERLKKIAEFGY